jgi:hypothetical protein
MERLWVKKGQARAAPSALATRRGAKDEIRRRGSNCRRRAYDRLPYKVGKVRQANDLSPASGLSQVLIIPAAHLYREQDLLT